MNIIISTNGQDVILHPESGPPYGIELSKDDTLNMIEQFIGDRRVFLRPSFTGVFDAIYASILKEADDCPECGRLVEESGLCSTCNDKHLTALLVP